MPPLPPLHVTVPASESNRCLNSNAHHTGRECATQQLELAHRLHMQRTAWLHVKPDAACELDSCCSSKAYTDNYTEYLALEAIHIREAVTGHAVTGRDVTALRKIEGDRYKQARRQKGRQPATKGRKPRTEHRRRSKACQNKGPCVP